jgi:hypothetical protein
MRRGLQQNKNFQGNIQAKQPVLSAATPGNENAVPNLHNGSKVPSKAPSKAVSVKGNDEQEKVEELKMEMDERKEDINLEEDNKFINLDEDDGKKSKKSGKKEYDLDDTIIRDIALAGNIHFQLISNVNGYFIDIRKFFNGYPTKKGIRILASKFATASDLLKADLSALVPPSK